MTGVGGLTCTGDIFFDLCSRKLAFAESQEWNEY